MSKEEEWYEQGDVVMKKIEALPKGDAAVQSDRVLAWGEVTGHKHQVVNEPGVEVLRIMDRLYVKALKEFTVRHEEHDPVVVPPGIWEIGIVRETDWLTRTVRKVAD